MEELKFLGVLFCFCYIKIMFALANSTALAIDSWAVSFPLPPSAEHSPYTALMHQVSDLDRKL